MSFTLPTSLLPIVPALDLALAAAKCLNAELFGDVKAIDDVCVACWKCRAIRLLSLLTMLAAFYVLTGWMGLLFLIVFYGIFAYKTGKGYLGLAIAKLRNLDLTILKH